MRSRKGKTEERVDSEDDGRVGGAVTSLGDHIHSGSLHGSIKGNMTRGPPAQMQPDANLSHVPSQSSIRTLLTSIHASDSSLPRDKVPPRGSAGSGSHWKWSLGGVCSSSSLPQVLSCRETKALTSESRRSLSPMDT